MQVCAFSLTLGALQLQVAVSLLESQGFPISQEASSALGQGVSEPVEECSAEKTEYFLYVSEQRAVSTQEEEDTHRFAHIIATLTSPAFSV